MLNARNHPCHCRLHALGPTSPRRWIVNDSNPQNAVFNLLDRVPSQVWYIAGVASILASAYCQATDRKQLALFIGQWPPTFILFGLYPRLIRPSEK